MATVNDKLTIEVFCDEDYCFVCGAWGKCTTSMLEEIEEEIAENYLPVQTGTYTFTAFYEDAQRDHEGRIEIQAYWDLTQTHYEPVPGASTPEPTWRDYEDPPQYTDDIPF